MEFATTGCICGNGWCSSREVSSSSCHIALEHGPLSSRVCWTRSSGTLSPSGLWEEAKSELMIQVIETVIPLVIIHIIRYRALSYYMLQHYPEVFPHSSGSSQALFECCCPKPRSRASNLAPLDSRCLLALTSATDYCVSD